MTQFHNSLVDSAPLPINGSLGKAQNLAPLLPSPLFRQTKRKFLPQTKKSGIVTYVISNILKIANIVRSQHAKNLWKDAKNDMIYPDIRQNPQPNKPTNKPARERVLPILSARDLPLVRPIGQMFKNFNTQTESLMENGLFPHCEPYQSGQMAAGDLHQIYWEQVGNPDGIPVVFLHGGPGAGCSPTHRRFFDPKFYRIILFDQRGCGRSMPLADTRENTTEHLIADIESLRQMLQIKKWLVFGGSWGSTLALAYGQTYPENCLGFILRGIFLCRPHEIDSFLYGMGRFFPEAWQKFSQLVPPDHRGDLLNAYLRLLNHPDPRIHLAAARAWARYEGACSTLFPMADQSDENMAEKLTYAVFDSTQDTSESEEPTPVSEQGLNYESRSALTLARLESHYMAHDNFLKNHDFFANMGWVA